MAAENNDGAGAGAAPQSAIHLFDYDNNKKVRDLMFALGWVGRFKLLEPLHQSQNEEVVTMR